MKMKRIACLMLVLAMVCAGAAACAQDNWLAGVLAGKNAVGTLQHTVAVLRIEGEIDDYGYYGDYDHEGTLETLAELCDDEGNEALLLVLNTPGGGLYEADELYNAILNYKETGRPVYAYMEQECCSAGVFLAMAADYIMAARMTITGNVGVYMQSYSEAGLYDKLGLECVYISSGENKTSGYPTLTDEQRAIYQALVDESFAIFKEAIASSRAMDEEQMTPFLDGRLLSASQAKELGLIDEVGYYEDMVDYLRLQVGADSGEIRLKDMTPERRYEGYDGLGGGVLNWLPDFEDFDIDINQEDSQRLFERTRAGVLMSLKH